MAGRGKKTRRARKATPPVEPPINWRESHDITHPKQRSFLAALSVWGNVTEAARIAGISRMAHYKWLGAVDEKGIATPEATRYKLACDEAIERAGDSLELRCWQLATDKKHPNITALIFMLKAVRPQKFRERFVTEHTGAGGGPIQTETATKVEVINMEELAQPERLAQVASLVRNMGLERQFPMLFPGGENGNGNGGGNGR
jgi:hypothetical protein